MARRLHTISEGLTVTGRCATIENSYQLIMIINHERMNATEQSVKLRLENFKQVSREYKLPLTPQKVAIFRTLAESSSHPRVQEIYEHVKMEFPSISLATVYKNIKQFLALGLAFEIPMPDGPARYDAKLEIHSHAVDTADGSVYDLELAPTIHLPEIIMGKKVKQAHVLYYL